MRGKLIIHEQEFISFPIHDYPEIIKKVPLLIDKYPDEDYVEFHKRYFILAVELFPSSLYIYELKTYTTQIGYNRIDYNLVSEREGLYDYILNLTPTKISNQDIDTVISKALKIGYKEISEEIFNKLPNFSLIEDYNKYIEENNL